jgi:isocitrate/isopropylmalate dehydrogenase
VPGSNISGAAAISEAVHDSAPDLNRQERRQARGPTVSGVMMLAHIQEDALRT